MAFNKRDIYLAFDKPIPFKKLILYPVRMKDYYMLGYLSQCLMLEKTADPNPMVAISMTYLQYLFHKAKDNLDIIQQLNGLLAMTLCENPNEEIDIKYKVGENNRPIIVIRGDEYNSDDFMEIREIIVEQNGLELPDERIQKNVRDAMEEARRFKTKLNGNKIASLEDQMLALSIYSGWDLDFIYNLTVRKFRKALMRANHMLYQKIYLQAQMSGMVTFKDKSVITGWLADIESDDKNSDVTVDLRDVESKVSFESAKQ